MALVGGARCALVAAALVVMGAAPGAGALDDPRAVADIRRALTLLNVVAEEYREGVVDGEVVLPVEYEEAQAFLAEADSRVAGAAPEAAEALAPAFAALRLALAERRPLDGVRAALEALRTAISRETGVVETIYPPAAPSGARGAALFAENCAPCHGAQADGRGPDAARLDPKPANFTDPEFMSRETPFSFFNIITAGKGRGMPAWGEVLSLQERWDLVSYLYSVQPVGAELADGERVYRAHCSGCHGGTGQGGGDVIDSAPALGTPAALARLTDADIAAAIAAHAGRAGTDAASLSAADAGAVTAYVRRLSLGGDDSAASPEVAAERARRFAGLLRLLGDAYQKGTAAGADEHAFTPADVLMGQLVRHAPRVQDALTEHDPTAAAALPVTIERLGAAVRARRPSAEVLALTGPLARTLDGHFAAARAESAGDALAAAQRLLDEAAGAYDRGDPRAVYLVSDAYFLFDPLEKPLALRDPALAQGAEARFAELRGAMAGSGQTHEVERLMTALRADLDAARAVLAAPQTSGYAVALQSALIILREGFEVVLIVGALLAYVRRAGVPTMRPPIVWGAVAGGLASLASAYLLVQLAAVSGATAEVIEGATMLLAAAVLFCVSYWLISKAEADRWQRYIQGKVKAALATGNALALAGAAFLAVYREGVETVLFYKALIDASPGAVSAAALGLATGAAGLLMLYALYVRLGARLPLRQFFLATGGVLYYLAVVFAGKGVAELQRAGWIGTTPVPGMPRIDLIGLYPTAETLAAQGVLLLCVVYALLVTARRSRREQAARARLSTDMASPGSAQL